MKKHLLTLLVSILFSYLSSDLFSQIQFEKIYDYSSDVLQLVQFEDESYIMLTDSFLIKIDPFGKPIWQKEHNTGAISLSTDGENIYLGGYTEHNDRKLFLAKYDSSANEIWYEEWGEVSSEGFFFKSMPITSDNAILLASRNVFDDGYGMKLFKYSLSGSKIWDIDLIYSDYDVTDLKEFRDDLYGVLISQTTSTSYSRMLLIDSSGYIKKDKYLSGDLEGSSCFDLIHDSTFVFLKPRGVHAVNSYLFEYTLDSITTLLHLSPAAYSYNFLMHDGSNYYLFGNSGNHWQDDYKFCFTSIDSVGNINWRYKYGGLNEEEAVEGIHCQDKGFMLFGFSNSWSLGDVPYLVKTDLEGYVSSCKDSLFATKDKYSVCRDHTFTIQSNSIGSQSTDHWIFNGDTIHSGNDPYDLYIEKPGEYELILKSCNDSILVPAEVIDTVSSNFTWKIENGGIQYMQDTVPEGWSWEWRMGDGTKLADSANPFYKYMFNGNYYTHLTFYDPCFSSTEKRVLYHLDIEEPDVNKPRIFPNPATSEISIIFQDKESYRIELYDCFGRMLVSNLVANTNLYILPLNDFPASLYILRIITDNQIIKHKILKI